MSARKEIAARLWMSVPSKDDDEAKTRTEEMLDAYRAEILAEAKVEVVAWLVKKDRENTPVGHLASKVDRGAVRIFLGTGHYRDAMDAHEAEVRAKAAADVHRAELPTFPADETPENVAKTVRAIDVRLAQHGAEAPYGVPEEATLTGATATPGFFQPGRSYLVDGHEYRCEHLSLHPVKSEREAWGWFHRGDDLWQHRRFYDTEWARSTPYTGGAS